MKSLLSFQNAATKEYLIVGLGNPGKEYYNTRHNVGFRAVGYFAKPYAIIPKFKRRVSAYTGSERRQDGVVIRILLPMTYMNKSGEAVQKAMKVFKVPVERLVVVVDDIALPFGDMRLKEKGSHGGHNGLRSLEEHLGTSHFARLRIGIGHPNGGDLADYVLSAFKEEEEKKLPGVFYDVAGVLQCWIEEGIPAAMTLANTKKNQ